MGQVMHLVSAFHAGLRSHWEPPNPAAPWAGDSAWALGGVGAGAGVGPDRDPELRLEKLQEGAEAGLPLRRRDGAELQRIERACRRVEI